MTIQSVSSSFARRSAVSNAAAVLADELAEDEGCRAEKLSSRCRRHYCYRFAQHSCDRPMTIRRLLKNSSLSPEGVNRLVAAYQKTLRTLDLVDRHDPVAEIVAKKVIEIGKRGGDAIEISKLAARELGVR